MSDLVPLINSEDSVFVTKMRERGLHFCEVVSVHKSTGQIRNTSEDMLLNDSWLLNVSFVDARPPICSFHVNKDGLKH